MKYFRIELDTKGLTAEQEDDLIFALDSVSCSRDCLDYDYGDFSVKPVQLPECVQRREDNWIYGPINIEGEACEDVLEKIYSVFEGEVPYVDNDPWGVRFEERVMNLIKFSVKHPKLAKNFKNADDTENKLRIKASKMG